MTVDALRLSPLAGWTSVFAGVAGLHLAEVPFLTQLNVRVAPGSAAAAAVGEVLGVPLPTRPCTSVAGNGRRVLWLGPDEFGVLAPDGAAASLEPALRAAAGGWGVTDVSAQRTTLTLSGPRAREVLARGCAIDLHPTRSPAGTCVQTLLALTGVTIVVDDAAQPAFTILVRASFAEYLAGWLVDAAATR